MAIDAIGRGEGEAGQPVWRRPLGLRDRAATAFLAEREQWALWLPVVLGLGILGYFALPAEPSWWIGIAWTAAGVATVRLLGPRALGWAIAGWIIAASGLGFAAAQARTAWVATPLLAERMGPVEVQGRVGDRETRADGSQRIVLGEVRIQGLSPGATPRQVRLSLNRKHAEEVAIGARVALRAVLLPASPPLAPGAFDFQRHAFFQGIGAVGFSVAPARAEAEDDPPWSVSAGSSACASRSASVSAGGSTGRPARWRRRC